MRSPRVVRVCAAAAVAVEWLGWGRRSNSVDDHRSFMVLVAGNARVRAAKSRGKGMVIATALFQRCPSAVAS